MKRFNFKWAIYVLLCVVILPIFCVCVVPSEKAFAQSDYITHEEAGKVELISGDFSGSVVLSSEDALNFLDNFKQTLNFSSSREVLKFNKEVQSVIGKVYRFDQYQEGTKVYGGELNVSVDNKGKVKSIMGSYYKDMAYNNEINYSIEEASAKVSLNHPDAEVKYVETVIVKTEESGFIAYIFDATNGDCTNKIFISARTLNITRDYETDATLRDSLPTSGYTITNVATTQTNLNGETVTLNIDKYTSQSVDEYFYVLADSERQIYVTNGQQRTTYSGYKYYDSYLESAKFDDSAAVQAYQYIMDCYDFYLDASNFGISIEGIKNTNGKNTKLIVIMHYGVNYENAAFVSGGTSLTSYFLFGDGNSYYGTQSFVKGKDVAGHEYQHAITDSVVALEYQNASGALSEAYSDIFGAVIEGHEMSDPEFWLMGEDIYTTSGRYFRDMSNPASTGCAYNYNDLHPYCTGSGCSNCAEGSCDNGGVHYNSTLMTYATYIMYQQNPDFFTESNILALWYQTLTKLTTTSDFEDFARAMLVAADELGYTADNKRDIEYAFASIGMPGYTGEETWNGNSLTYLQGSGTIASPYLINSVADLASLAYYVNNNTDNGIYRTARYRLTADLDLSGVDWLGIGTVEYPFDGYFNGGSKTISNLNITGNVGDTYAGLFRYTGENSYIYDLNIGSGNVTTNAEYAGAIVGKLMGGLSGCSSALNIIGKNVGGLVGLLINSDGGQCISNSFTTSDLEGETVGGIVATFSTTKNTNLNLHMSGYIVSSYTTGTLSGAIVGGLVGEGNGLYIANNITTATLTASSSNAVLGGFIGKLYFKNPLETTETLNNLVANYVLSSKSTVNFITGQNTKVGLIIGENLGELGDGNIYIENTVVKTRDGFGYCSTSLDGSNIKIVNTKMSENTLYEGVFDFDSESYYKNLSNWTILDGIEAFNLDLTFEIVSSGKMPTFKSSGFWLDYNAYSFAGGSGTADDPYEISSAVELALLAKALFIDSTYASYASCHYELTADIDLAGKIWTGIGYTKITVVNGITMSAQLKAFKGTFNGNGYTIYNMSSVGAYSVSATDSSGTSYVLSEFLPSLFGATCATISNSEMFNPEIKNVTLDNVNIKGNYSAGVVSRAYFGVDVQNVTISSGSITSSGIAGGIVAKIETTGEAISASTAVSNIKSCTTACYISGNVVGGAVGYVTNAGTNADNEYIQTTLNIENHLNEGTISTSGDNFGSVYSATYGSYSYYRPVAGSMIGVTLVRTLNLTNCINMGNVVSYNENPMLGGFIACIGVGDRYVQNTMTINVNGCYQTGDVYYIFDNLVQSDGAIIGYTHQNLSSLVTLNVYTSQTNQDVDLVKAQNMIAFLINSDLNDQDLLFVVFVNYNEQILKSYQVLRGSVLAMPDDLDTRRPSDNKYKYDFIGWDYDGSEVTKNIVVRPIYDTTPYYKVEILNYNGEEIETYYVLEGETFVLPDGLDGTRPSDAQYNYVFTGWDYEEQAITENITINPTYDLNIRSYEVKYFDEDGNLIETKTLEYGAEIDQQVEAPVKKGNLFIEYEFVRWGEDGQKIEGETSVKPVYEGSLTGMGTAIIFFIAIIVMAGIVASASKKKVG